MALESKDLVIGRHGKGWSVGSRAQAMVLTRSREEAEKLAKEAAVVMRKRGIACTVQGPQERRPPEPRSFRKM